MTKKFSFLFVMFVFAVLQLGAQSKTGTSVGAFLSIEPSARIAAMGNAGVTLYGDPEAVYYNPGAIGYHAGTAAQFTHAQWIAGIAYNYGVFAMGMGDVVNCYATVTSLNSGEIDVRTVEQPLGTGERYTVSDVAVGVGIGRQISERFSAGVQINYVQETIWHSVMSAVSFSVGTMYRLSPDGLRLGASISNFGSRGQFDGRDLRVLYDQNAQKYGDNGQIPAEILTNDYPLPVMFRIGLGLPFRLGDANRFMLAVDAFHPSDNTESVSVGGEYVFDDFLAVRAGYQNMFQQDSELGLTLGGGVKYEMGTYKFSLDYCWADQGRLTDSQRITIGISF
jgi:hypothetical protein